jgi:flagellar biosynthetic protein FliR
MVVPIFGNRLVPTRVRIGVLFGCAMLVASVLPEPPAPLELSLSLVVVTLYQLLAGIALGFSAVMFFQVFVISGQFIGMQMGLGFAAMVDPGNGVSVTVWSQFFLMLATLAFLSVNGHLILLEVLIEGFLQHPAGLPVSRDSLLSELVSFAAWMFAGGLRLALPAVVSLLIVNIAFGIMNRAAPQLNVFSLGFPFGLLFGLVIVWSIIGGWESSFNNLLNEYLNIYGVVR